MNKNLPLDRQVEDLYNSRYEVGWEAVKGFARAALPALITFGIGGAIATGLLVGGAALLGAMGITTGFAGITASAGGVAGAIATGGAIVGGAAATITGTAAGVRTMKDIGERNDAIDIQIRHLRAAAIELGDDIPDPAKQQELEQQQEKQQQMMNQQMSGQTAPPSPNATESQRSAVVQQILDRGHKSLAPENIIARTGKDVMGLFR